MSQLNVMLGLLVLSLLVTNFRFMLVKHRDNSICGTSGKSDDTKYNKQIERLCNSHSFGIHFRQAGRKLDEHTSLNWNNWKMHLGAV